MAPLEAYEIYPLTCTVFGINRVEPRESNSRPVFGRVFVLKVGRIGNPTYQIGGRHDYRCHHSTAARRLLLAASPGSLSNQSGKHHVKK